LREINFEIKLVEIRTTGTITEIIESQYRVGMAINAIPVWVTSGVPEFGGVGVIELGGSVIVSSYSAAVAKVFFGMPHTCDTCIDTSVTRFIIGFWTIWT